jgi:dipeptidyl aminopeptidase/acylaminoacyl peptidase
MGAPHLVRLRRRLFATLLPAVILLALAGAASAHGGTRIIVREGARRVVAISPHGGKPQTLVHLRRGAMLGTAVSRDGKVIAFASRTFHKVAGDEEGHRIEHDWTDRIWVMRAGGRPRVVRTIKSAGVVRGRRSVDSLALSPDGRQVLIQNRRGAVFLMRSDGSGIHRVLPMGYEFHGSGGHDSCGIRFTPDGRRLIGVFYPPTRRVTDIGGIGTVSVHGGPVHFLTRGPFTAQYGHFDAPTISPDGRHVAFVRSGPRGIRIDVMNRDGSAVHTLRATLMPGWNFANPSFSPSGRSLTLIGTHPGVAGRPGTGNTIIGRTPSVLFTVGLDGRRPRRVQTETARRYERDPLWVAWPGSPEG